MSFCIFTCTTIANLEPATIDNDLIPNYVWVYWFGSHFYYLFVGESYFVGQLLLCH